MASIPPRCNFFQLSMSVPSGLENLFLRIQTEQLNSEVQTEEHSKITESVKSG